MKIGILIDRLNVGGVEKIAIEEVKALRGIGEDAYLVVLSKKAVTDNAFKDLLINVPIIFLDERMPFFLRFSFKFPIFSFFSFFHLSYPFLLPWFIEKGEFDYIISHGTYTCFSAIGIKKIKGIPYSAFIWDPINYILGKAYSTDFKRFLLEILKKAAQFLDGLIIKNADVVLVGGTVHNAYFKTIFPGCKIKVIYPSVHPLVKLFSKKDYILTVTAWKKGKNPEYIFELLDRLPQLKIKIAGRWLDKNYQYEFEKELKKNKRVKNVTITGEVSERELSKLLGESLAVLQINDDRGFGMPALEAAGNGSTFIIPEGQGVCALFKNKVHGFYTKERETKKIIRYLTLLLRNKEKAREMGEKAWQKVKASYSWEKHAEDLLSVVTVYAK